MVHQLDSYRYWASYLGRSDLAAGNFGENLTVDGLANNEVCIGDLKHPLISALHKRIGRP